MASKPKIEVCRPPRESRGFDPKRGRGAMTELMGKELSRRSFVERGGALIVGFSLLGAAAGSRASAADSPFSSNGPFNQAALDTWIAVQIGRASCRERG